MAKQKLYTFKNVKNPDFKTVGVNGVFGGMTVRGQLNMNFYLETLDLPKVAQHEIVGTTLSSNPVATQPPSEPTAIREMQFGVLLDIDVAKSVITWMQDHVNEFERKFGKIDP